jgi:hypothetical protein
MKKIQSVEPNIADLANTWLKSYKLDYKLQHQSLNTEIDQALNDYSSKNGGTGGNIPDVKLLLQDNNLDRYPILIEYKGYKDKLVKLDPEGRVVNKTSKNLLDFKTINSYAVNGAVHYANALLHYTSYSDIIAIGMSGYRDDTDKLQYEIGVYYVSKSNFGIGQKVDDYSDFSFLKKENFHQFIERVKQLQLTQSEIENIREHREKEITASLIKLNNDIFKSEDGLSERDRVYLVAASIIATLGVPGKVTALEKNDLKSSEEHGYKDGDIIYKKIDSFLQEKKLPSEKRNLIARTLQNTLTSEKLNKVKNGESQLKRIFTKIIDDLGIYYKIGLTTDFTGKLFNEMYSWLGFSQDKLNDVVLTPSYVATLLAKLARVNMDSFVWDFATGSAGLLVASMNEMLIDAKNKIKSPEQLEYKSAEIKANQLLGLEVLPDIYMLAILNMILMGDGHSNIINKDSLTEYNGNYGYNRTDEKFPATAFVLNPPYSAKGKGMIFVEKALSMMNKGYAAIIIQTSAGSGKAIDYNKKILMHSTLLASIKMPTDLFVGKSNVQTSIYVFHVGEAHHKDNTVKFIDFSVDGYTRTNRRKSKDNLRDTDHAKERYEELVNLVRFGRKKLHYYTEKEYYEGNIDPENGSDWNQTTPIDPKPSLEDIKRTINDYLVWKVSNLIKNQNIEEKTKELLKNQLETNKWRNFKLGDLFDIKKTKSFDANKLVPGDEYDYVTRTSNNQGILQSTGFIDDESINSPGTWSLGLMQMDFFYREKSWYAGQFVRIIIPKIKIPQKATTFFTTLLNRQTTVLLHFKDGISQVNNAFRNIVIQLPITSEGEIDFDFMETFIENLEKEYLTVLTTYVKQTTQEKQNNKHLN